MPTERIQKILGRFGIASRRKSEKLIQDGRVKINGKIIRTLGSKADAQKDDIWVEGIGRIECPTRVYIAMHKPIHVMTTTQDPEGRTTIMDILYASRALGAKQFEGHLPNIFPIGRLDFDASGLILLSNDGELSNQLLHPRSHVPKTYMVKVKGRPSERALEKLRQGVFLPGVKGRKHERSQGADITLVKRSPKNTWIEITIFEGKHHQIKRMCQSVDHRILSLIRTHFANISLDDLPEGAWRFLSIDEITKLQKWS